MEKIIDTNIIIRYLIQDDIEMAKKAESIIKNHVKIFPEILSEVVYVLEGYYEVSRKDIEFSLKDFIEDVYMDDKEIYIEVLTNYGNTKIDFVDCILLARDNLCNSIIYTFDKKLNSKLLNG